MSLGVYIALTLMGLVATLLLPYETKGRSMQVSIRLQGERFIIVRSLCPCYFCNYACSLEYFSLSTLAGLSYHRLFLDILEVLKRAVVVD